MKRLMIAIAMCVAAVAVDAAQCEGLTQKGERCKREAAEGSKFCIGHADQAKKDVKSETKEQAAPKGKAEPKEKPASKESAASKDKAAPKQKPAQKAAVEQKDDGTCWAVTEAGTRCKHKKDGESDYCKQHAASVKPSEPVTQCRAMTYEGTQCTRKPEEGKRYCKQHMGK